MLQDTWCSRTLQAEGSCTLMEARGWRWGGSTVSSRARTGGTVVHRECETRCRECKLSNAELVVFPCLEVACISVSFRHKQTITTSCARTTTFPLGRTNSLRCSSASRHAVLLTPLWEARYLYTLHHHPLPFSSCLQCCLDVLQTLDLHG